MGIGIRKTIKMARNNPLISIFLFSLLIIFILMILKLFRIVNTETDLYRWTVFTVSIIWYTPVILAVISLHCSLRSYVKKSGIMSEKAFNRITVFAILPVFLIFDSTHSLFISNKILEIIGLSTSKIADLAGLFSLDLSHLKKTGLPVHVVMVLCIILIALMWLISLMKKFIGTRRR